MPRYSMEFRRVMAGIAASAMPGEVPSCVFLSGFSRCEVHRPDMGTIARSDVELVEASRRGEHEAFGHLVARYQDVVCAVSFGATGDQGLSEDVAQDTFIAAWRQLDRLR